MLVPFRLGGGARFGSGEQYFSVISLRDWVGATLHLLADSRASGAYNLALPTPPTNREFTEALARQLRRPALLAVPAAPLKLVLGDLSTELLGSLRVVPQRLTDAGFAFADPDVVSALATAMAPRSVPAAG
jgi:NAD dependent epimerase/dehydratase family enzyme